MLLQLTGILPPEWGASLVLPQMRILHLEGNNLVGELPVEWAEDIAWPRLQELGLSNNNLTGTIPEEWVKASSTVLQNFPLSQVVLGAPRKKVAQLIPPAACSQDSSRALPCIHRLLHLSSLGFALALSRRPSFRLLGDLQAAVTLLDPSNAFMPTQCCTLQAIPSLETLALSNNK